MIIIILLLITHHNIRFPTMTTLVWYGMIHIYSKQARKNHHNNNVGNCNHHHRGRTQKMPSRLHGNVLEARPHRCHQTCQQQRMNVLEIVPYRAVPCRAVPCRAVLRGTIVEVNNEKCKKQMAPGQRDQAKRIVAMGSSSERRVEYDNHFYLE